MRLCFFPLTALGRTALQLALAPLALALALALLALALCFVPAPGTAVDKPESERPGASAGVKVTGVRVRGERRAAQQRSAQLVGESSARCENDAARADGCGANRTTAGGGMVRGGMVS